MIDNKISEIMDMLNHLTESGTEIPGPVQDQIEQVLNEHSSGNDKNIKGVISLHNQLAQLIKPAIPRSIYGNRNSTIYRLTKSPPIVWSMLAMGVMFLLGLIYLSGSGYVTPENLDAGSLYNIGKDSYYPALYILLAAGLGAVFYNLNSMYHYIITNSYDPRYVSSYWVRLVLGIVAGYMIAQLIDLDIDTVYDKPLLALVGGYSVEVVSWALTRFVETLKTLIQGSLDTSAERFKNKLEFETNQIKIKTTTKLAKQILAATNQLSDEDRSSPAGKKLDELLSSVLNEK